MIPAFLALLSTGEASEPLSVESGLGEGALGNPFFSRTV